ncbi:Protein of unknown function [Rhizobium tibeticum]|uniref:DUF2934 domain-containing protein n=1 Tax=Rhizobium tibeticum TaxID=501024 RepID=A0A1H8UPD8_9HYPH|nr:DUF2934 domain-containing protein [Rhizobium tibeticum]SEI17716.1 hypothetical protein RTCCBAU85039_5692 [Rhizobium tibeticum]SEP04956.1 Protein of unknown function [Rhizobium tibeticum]
MARKVPIQGTRPDETAIATSRDRRDDVLVGNRTERIRRRAYELWEREGSPPGRHDDYWLQAEREILHGNDEFKTDDDPDPDSMPESARQHSDAVIPDRGDAVKRETTPAVDERTGQSKQRQ